MRKYKKFIDQEIQEKLDKRIESFDATNRLETHEDAENYSALFDNLDEPFEIDLGSDFAENVALVAQKKKRIHDFTWKFILYLSISIPLILMCAIVALAMDPEIFWTMVGALKNSSVYVLFGLALFTIIQVLDQKIVKNNLPDLRT